jgi:hypothetical protein
MYRNFLRLSGHRREIVERPSRWQNFAEARANHRKNPQRTYHSGAGVYGHREKVPREFQGCYAGQEKFLWLMNAREIKTNKELFQLV